MTADPFAQTGFGTRLDWGPAGLAALAAECAVLVVVDVLSFGTAVDVAVGRGARVLPLRHRDDRGVAQARAAGAVLGGERGWTLRPASLTDLPAGTLLALASPNGATLCADAARTGAAVLAGCLRNASAVAARAAALAGGGPVGVLAAGERWGVGFGAPAGDGSLRPCAEDLLGAGAIVAALPGTRSPEAELAAGAFQSVADALPEALRHSGSGRELSAAGHGADLALAAAHDVSATAPLLTGGVLG